MDNKIIDIKNLSYSYPDGSEALKDINLEFFEGESCGIIGPNGAGKSTLLLHLNGILRSNGPIKVFDLEVNDTNLSLIRSKVGLVFQDPDNQLFMPTVFDDVSFGPINMKLPKKEIQDSVEQALNEVDMSDCAAKNAYHLSFGEKKRVSLATVLSMKPKVLVLDEPSSNLDHKHRRGLINFLKNIKITKIIASHDLELVLEICSRVVLLDKARLIASGDTYRILSDVGLLSSHSLEVPPSMIKAEKFS